MNASPPARSADHHTPGPTGRRPRIGRLLCYAIGLIWMLASATACDGAPVVEPDPAPLQPKVDKLKKKSEAFDQKVEETLENKRTDIGVSVDDATD